MLVQRYKKPVQKQGTGLRKISPVIGELFSKHQGTILEPSENYSSMLQVSNFRGTDVTDSMPRSYVSLNLHVISDGQMAICCLAREF